MANETDYVELGLACADVCRALDRGVNVGRVDDVSPSVFEAIDLLTTSVWSGMYTPGDSLTKLSIL